MNRIIHYTQPGAANLFPLFASRRPWTGLEAEADRLFEHALADFAATARAPRFPVDLYEDKDSHYVRASLPGVSREGITVEMVDGYLTIGATQKNGEESFNLSRSIAIPQEVQADKVAAAYENGVLTVTLPKQEQAKPRKINVTIN
jgi:HSP20 family protein